MIRAILLDLGGPVFCEDAEYACWTEILLTELNKNGVHVSRETFTNVVEEELKRCEPNPWLAALWRFMDHDLGKFRQILEVFRTRNRTYQETLPGVFIRPEALAIIPELAQRFVLAVAANQPPQAISLLEEAGLLKYFAWREVSGTMGIAKPSPLFFRMILDEIGATPEEAVMVGDRLEHDIFPARLLGMKTVRVLHGPYAQQIPPSSLHSPHLSVPDLSFLPQALVELECAEPKC